MRQVLNSDWDPRYISQLARTQGSLRERAQAGTCMAVTSAVLSSDMRFTSPIATKSFHNPRPRCSLRGQILLSVLFGCALATADAHAHDPPAITRIVWQDSRDTIIL